MRIFLHHAIPAAAYPQISVAVEAASVKEFGEEVRISPGIDHIAVAIKFNYRRSLTPGFQLVVRQFAPVQDEHVILSIHAYRPQLPCYPGIRQGLGPIWIHLVLRRVCLRLQWLRTKNPKRDNKCYECYGQDEGAYYPLLLHWNFRFDLHARNGIPNGLWNATGPTPVTRRSPPRDNSWLVRQLFPNPIPGECPVTCKRSTAVRYCVSQISSCRSICSS